MKKSLAVFVALAVWTAGAAAWAQCGSGGGAAKADASAAICPTCGELAPSANCCTEDVAICPGCGLHKGSPGCLAKCAPKKEAPAD